MSLRVNLSEVEGSSFDAIPSGRYPLNVFDGEIRTSESERAKHPGSQYIAWEFTVDAGDFEGRHLWENTLLDHADCTCGDEEKFNKGLFKLKQLFSATGKWTDEQLDSDEFSFEIDDVLGSKINGQVRRTNSEEYGEGNSISKFLRQDAGSTSSSVLP
jgi:hypothetical protein